MKKEINAGRREHDVLMKNAKFKRRVRLYCPKCTEKLAVYDVYKVEIERCEKCRGIWFDRDELRRLKDRSEKKRWGDLRWMDDEIESIEKTKARNSSRPCVRCRPLRMLTVRFDQTKTLIDYCLKCHGVWLDQGEYKKILEQLRHNLDRYSSKEMAEKVIEEMKEIGRGPESTVSELLDVKAALSALINISIFEHPKLTKLLIAAGKAGRSVGA